MKYIKTMGLVLGTTLALVMAGGASASAAIDFHTETGEEVSWNVSSQNSGDALELINATNQFACSDPHFSAGTQSAVSQESLSGELHFSKCVTENFFNIKVNQKCIVTLEHTGETIGVNCGPKGTVFAQLFNCSIVADPESGLPNVHYKNRGVGSNRYIEASAWVELPFHGCGGKVVLDVTWKITGTETKSGKQVGVWIEHPSPPSPSFHAESWPGNLRVVPHSPSTLTFGKTGTLSCNSGVSMFGRMEEPAIGTVSLMPVFPKCIFLFFNVYPYNESCTFDYYASGGFGVGGEGCAENPIKFTGAGCTVTIGPQSGGATTYTNEGSGSTRTVKVGQVTGIKYSTVGATCPLGSGTFTNGTYTTSTVIEDEDEAEAQRGLWVE